MRRWLWSLCGWIALVGLTGVGWAAPDPAAPTGAAPRVLWITGEVTPLARTAQLKRLAQQVGWGVVHLDYPLRGDAMLRPDQAVALRHVLAQAHQVWIDAPHSSVSARLRGLLSAELARSAAAHAGRVVWVEPMAAGSPAPGVAAYLQAGGDLNLRHALALAQAEWSGQPSPALPPPQVWPARGIYHPQAPRVMADAVEFASWQAGQAALRHRPAVAVLVHRHHFVNGTTAWLDDWLQRFAQQGLLAYAVFGQQVDAAGLRALLAGPAGAAELPQAYARVIVTHQLLTQGAALQSLWAAWGVPVLATQVYRQGGPAEWEADPVGLGLSDVPFYLAQPEAAGTHDPLLVAAQTPQGDVELLARQADAVVNKARRLVALQTLPKAEQRLVAMVYNYPPGGSNFGASFLNVPRSLEQVSEGLSLAGYATQKQSETHWVQALQPLLSAYYPGADLDRLLAQDQAAALPLARYLAWWQTVPTPVRQRIESHWGPPERSRYVRRWQGELVFVIPRHQVGALSVLPQPPREETLRMGQNPFMHRQNIPVSHHYLATYLWAGDAQALIHFGTHGTQEWAPGKARGLDVWDDALLPLSSAADHIPVVYPYIVDNLGEALTAKRRGRAVLVSHRTPTLAPAGFESRMAHMHELMHEWETVDAGPTKQALERQLLAQFVEHRLHKDLGWSAQAIAADFEGFLERLHPYLDQLAQSSQPQGLAVFGRVPSEAQRRQTILQALRKPLIEALGEDIDEAFLIDHQAVANSRPARWLAVALQDPEAASRLDLRPALPEALGPEPADGLVRAADFVPNRAARQAIDHAALLQLAHRARALEALLAQEGEMPGLLAALSGRFVPAAYGGDPLRNPDSLPTGRNLTGLDPSRLPTRQAYAVAQTLFADWLAAWQQQHGGRPPARLALSLWAGETLRHQGVMEAQALVALGVRPVWDESGRPQRIEVIPRAQLQRPRVDVLLSVTGSYRDQFPALMALVDQAVAAVSEAEADSVVARHTQQVQAELRRGGVPARLARDLATARVFGNVAGDYGTGLSDAVQADGLRAGAQPGQGDARLGRMFLTRMSQPYLAGQALPVGGAAGAQAAQALGAHLRLTDAAVLSRSSHLYALASSDDPFQYLGGLAAAARAAGKTQALSLYVNQLQDATDTSTDTAQRALALELKARYLHPGWLAAQKSEGYAGTLQVLKAVQYIWGWQAVAPDTVRPDHWQSFFEVLVKDRHQLGLPDWLRSHPQAYAQAVERLVQAQRLGYWSASAADRQQLAGLYRELTQAQPLAQPLVGVQRWVEGQLQPLAAPTPMAVSVAPVRGDPQAPSAPARKGVVLQRQPPELPPQTSLPEGLLLQALALCGMALMVIGGALWQGRRPSPPPHWPGRPTAV